MTYGNELQHLFKRKDGQQVKKEPSFEILAAYCLAVIDDIIGFIMICGIKVNKNVDQKQEIDSIIKYVIPVHFLDNVNKCKIVRSQSTSDQ